MALDISNLTAAVAKIDGVEASAKAAILGLTAKVQELIDASTNTVDPAALQAVVDDINAKADDLAAAIPATPTPSPQ